MLLSSSGNSFCQPDSHQEPLTKPGAETDRNKSVAQQPVSNPGGDLVKSVRHLYHIFSIALAIIATMETKRRAIKMNKAMLYVKGR